MCLGTKDLRWQGAKMVPSILRNRWSVDPFWKVWMLSGFGFTYSNWKKSWHIFPTYWLMTLKITNLFGICAIYFDLKITFPKKKYVFLLKECLLANKTTFRVCFVFLFRGCGDLLIFLLENHLGWKDVWSPEVGKSIFSSWRVYKINMGKTKTHLPPKFTLEQKTKTHPTHFKYGTSLR